MSQPPKEEITQDEEDLLLSMVIEDREGQTPEPWDEANSD